MICTAKETRIISQSNCLGEQCWQQNFGHGCCLWFGLGICLELLRGQGLRMILAIAPWIQPESIRWKTHGALAFSAGVISLPVPFDFAFGGTGPRHPEFRLQQQQRMVLLAQLSQPQKAFQPSRKLTWIRHLHIHYSTKKSRKRPQKLVKVSHAKNSLGISWFQQCPSQAYERDEAYGTKTHQASSCWAILGTEWHEGIS